MTTSSRTPSAPGSTSSLRAANQSRVLGALRTALADEAPTQAELARMTGLAPATVSNIVRELSTAGLVESEPGSGRRGSSIRLSPAAGLVAGVDFGHSHVAVAVGDLTGRVLAEERTRTTDQLGHVEALELASSILRRLLDGRGPLRQVGLGLPAPVKNNVVRSAAIFPGWEDVDAGAAAAAVFGVPVQVENDANLGALAEHRQGTGRGHNTLVFVKIASGVGAGIVVDDRLFHGADGTAGEIGHLTISDQGPMCRCGSRGCLETYTSSEHILRLVSATLPGATLQDLARRGDLRQRLGPAGAGGRRAPPGLGAGQPGQPAQPLRGDPRRRDGAGRRPAARTLPAPGCAATPSTRSPRRPSSRASSAAVPAWWARCCSPPRAPSSSATERPQPRWRRAVATSVRQRRRDPVGPQPGPASARREHGLATRPGAGEPAELVGERPVAPLRLPLERAEPVEVGQLLQHGEHLLGPDRVGSAPPPGRGRTRGSRPAADRPVRGSVARGRRTVRARQAEATGRPGVVRGGRRW